MDDEGTRMEGEWGWEGTGRADREKRIGGHTVMPIGSRCKRPCHVKRQRNGRGRSEVREAAVLASCFVRGACAVDIVSFCEGCCGLRGQFWVVKFVYISGGCSVHSVSDRAKFAPPEPRLLCAVLWAPGQAVAETMVAA